MHQGESIYNNSLEKYLSERKQILHKKIMFETSTHLKVESFSLDSFKGQWNAAMLPYLQYMALDHLRYLISFSQMTTSSLLSVYEQWRSLKNLTGVGTNESLFESYVGLFPFVGSLLGDTTLPRLVQLINEIQPACKTKDVLEGFVMVEYDVDKKYY